MDKVRKTIKEMYEYGRKNLWKIPDVEEETLQDDSVAFLQKVAFIVENEESKDGQTNEEIIVSIDIKMEDKQHGGKDFARQHSCFVIEIL